MTLFTADIGKGKVHIYDSGRDKFYGKLPQRNLIDLNIRGLEDGDTLLVEDSHLRESHKLTTAQPYSWEDLNEFYDNSIKKGITILAFPHKSTPKARKLSGYGDKDKSDEADTKSIANFVSKDINAFNTLKKFVPTRLKDYQEKNSHIHTYIEQANEDINEAKSSEYGFKPKKFDFSDEVTKWINKWLVKIVEELDCDPELVKAIGIGFDRKGVAKVVVGNRIYTLVHSLLRPDGTLRVRPDRADLDIDEKYKVPNWKYIKAHYLGCKPYHMNQGVPASNYKHWMRRAVSEYAFPDKLRDKNDPLKMAANCTDFQVGMSYEELAKLKKARTKVDKMTQTIFYALRKMIVDDGLR